MENIKEILTGAVLTAGRYVKEHQQKIGKVFYKEKEEVVTEIDIKAEKIIKDFLKKHFPNYNYYGEEEGDEKHKSEFTFLIDPIDGTGRYVSKTDWYCIIIALLKNNDPIACSVFIPNKNELYYAEKGKGAYLNNRRIYVSKSDSFNKETVSLSTRVRKKIKGYLEIKSIGFDSCLVAKGEINGTAKIYKSKGIQIEGPEIYLLVTEAGGKVTDFKGKPWDINTDNIIFSNGIIHDDLIDLLKEVN